MHFRHQTTWAAGLALFLQDGLAQDLDETIVGCADVQCPTKSGSTAAECKVGDNTFGAIGLARIPIESETLEGLSWVQGVSVTDSDNDKREFEKTFFLGAPSDFAFNGTGACALFFTKVSDRVSFGEANDDQSTTQGTCDEALSKSCVSAIISRAKDLDFEDLSSEEACKKLEEEFQDNLDSECQSFADGNKWQGLRAIPLSETEVITSQDNSSSNCWPIEPKSYDLSVVGSFKAEGDYLVDTAFEQFHGITPILTVFFPGDSDEVVSKVEGQMTCMKTIGRSVAENATESADDANKDNAAAGLAMGSQMVLLVAFVASLYLAC